MYSGSEKYAGKVGGPNKVMGNGSRDAKCLLACSHEEKAADENKARRDAPNQAGDAARLADGLLS